MKYLILFLIVATLTSGSCKKKRRTSYTVRKPVKPSPIDTRWSNEWVDSKFLNITPDESKHLIVDELEHYFDNDTVFVDISSGRSPYITYFAQRFPLVTFKPVHFKRVEKKDAAMSYNLTNVKEPVYFDVTSAPKFWFGREVRRSEADYIFTATLVNTFAMKNTSDLFHAAALYLKPDAYLFMYGIFQMNGKVACKEAIEIDRELRKKDFQLGIREITLELTHQAYVYGLFLDMVYELPNCHQILAWQKDEIGGPEYGTRKFQPEDRYQETLFQHLKRYVLNETLFVEITAGTGQLSAYLAAHLPRITFVPADHDATFLPRMLRNVEEYSGNNLEKPFYFDVRNEPVKWFDGAIDEETVDYVFNSNLVHLAPSECYKGLMRGSNYYLKERGYLFMFGVFKYYNHTSPQCNIDLDEKIRKANPIWGLRDVQLELIQEAEKHRLYLVVIHNFPFHQQLLVFKKGSRLLC